jgi:uncharacterized protein YidB (DUF937 family)
MSGLFGQLAGSFLSNPGLQQALPGLLGQLVGSGAGGAAGGGLQSLIGQLESAGLGNVVNSWVGSGPNQPIAPEQLAQALPPEQVQSMAQQAGTTPEALLQMLAHALPHAVDHATPNGEVPAAGASTPDFAGMIGKLFGG